MVSVAKHDPPYALFPLQDRGILFSRPVGLYEAMVVCEYSRESTGGDVCRYQKLTKCAPAAREARAARPAPRYGLEDGLAGSTTTSLFR